MAGMIAESRIDDNCLRIAIQVSSLNGGRADLGPGAGTALARSPLVPPPMGSARGAGWRSALVV